MEFAAVVDVVDGVFGIVVDVEGCVVVVVVGVDDGFKISQADPTTTTAPRAIKPTRRKRAFFLAAFCSWARFASRWARCLARFSLGMAKTLVGRLRFTYLLVQRVEDTPSRRLPFSS